ncbi:MAG: hypothetical protein IJQ98_11105 [Oscillospiraceae bacterium]|nr:hypothetical protein [Oscillospiraceae bacterium]
MKPTARRTPSMPRRGISGKYLRSAATWAKYSSRVSSERPVRYSSASAHATTPQPQRRKFSSGNQLWLPPQESDAPVRIAG